MKFAVESTSKIEDVRRFLDKKLPFPPQSPLGKLYKRPTTSGSPLCHFVLCASPEGVPLGILHQHIWARDPQTQGVKHQRHQRTTAQKESQRWLEGLSATQHQIPAGVKWLMVGDREADSYNLFAQATRTEADILVHAAHDRLVW
jgi:hypothetical protein